MAVVGDAEGGVLLVLVDGDAEGRVVAHGRWVAAAGARAHPRLCARVRSYCMRTRPHAYTPLHAASKRVYVCGYVGVLACSVTPGSAPRPAHARSYMHASKRGRHRRATPRHPSAPHVSLRSNEIRYM